MSYVQRAAGASFLLILGVLILFLAVKDTKPSGSATLPILYGLAALCAVVWLVATLRKPHTTPPAGRIGYRGRPGSSATFNRTRFGRGLDTAIDNEGRVDVQDSDLD